VATAPRAASSEWVGDYDGLWRSLVLRDVVSGSYPLLNVTTGEYIERYLRPDPDGRDVGALFDQIIASTRRVPRAAGTAP